MIVGYVATKETKHKDRCINLQLYQDQSLQLNIYVDDER